MTLKELQLQVHTLAQAKGWWPPERDPDEVFALMHSEISEALEEWRTGKPLTFMKFHGADGGLLLNINDEHQTLVSGGINWPLALEEASLGSKPEGFMVELADLVIRIADAAQAWEIELFFMEGGLCTKSVAKLVCHFHEQVVKAQHPQHARECLSMCVCSCFFFAKQHNVDLFQVFHLKHAFNATRPHRHGKIA